MPIAIITGANKGLGLELCKQLKDKYTIYAICRKPSEELKKLQVHIIDNIDLSKESDFNKLLAELKGVQIDLLCNNAGVYFRDTLENLSFENFMKTFAINTIAPIMLVKALFPKFNKGAKIIMMSSRMGSIEDTSTGRSYSYRASKAALNSLGKTLSVELKDKDIYTLLIHPGSVKTDMTNHDALITTETSVKGIIQRIDQLNSDHNGKFYAFDDRELPW